MISVLAWRLSRAAGAGIILVYTASCADAFQPTVGHRRGDVVSDGASASIGGGGGVSFARDIRPLMNRSDTDPTGHGCKACHYSNAGSQLGLDLGGLDLTTLGTLREGGGSSGRNIVVPGDPDGSAIVQKLRGTYPIGAHMPKNGPPYWNAQQIQLVVDWITQGALGGPDE